MDSQLLEKLIKYREIYQLDLAKVLLKQKIVNQTSVCGGKRAADEFVIKVDSANDIPTLLIVEAHVAKAYWKEFSKRLGRTYPNFHRRAHRCDPPNQLLDVGYHYLTRVVIAWCRQAKFPSELGFFHTAQSAGAQPFAYDFVEWLRPITVDRAVRAVVSKQKRPRYTATPEQISKTVHLVKRELDRLYFHRQLGYCVRLEYWAQLLLLNLREQVSSQQHPYLYFPSLRHETRCRKM